MQRSIYLLVLTTLFCAVQCRKSPEQPLVPLPHRLIPSDMRAYWAFQPGTYWIYQDSVSGVFDTVTVIEFASDTFEGVLSYNQEHALCEALALRLQSSAGYGHDYSINTTSASSSPSYQVVYDSKYDTFGYDGATKAFVFPLTIGNATYLSDGQTTDTCKVAGLFGTAFGYQDVVLMRHNHNMAEDDQHTRFYFAKNIGIIRKELVDSNKVYNLIDYHIEP